MNKSSGNAIKNSIEGYTYKEYIGKDLSKTVIPAFIGLWLMFNPYFVYIKNAHSVAIIIFFLSLIINKKPLGNFRKSVLFYLRLITLSFIIIFVTFVLLWLFFHSNELTFKYVAAFITNIITLGLMYEYLSKLSQIHFENKTLNKNVHVRSLVGIFFFLVLNLLTQTII